MRVNTLLLIGMILVIGYAGISVDTRKCKTDRYDNWDVFTCPCSGGSGDYDYQYSKLPSGWYANKDKIYIPKSKIQKQKYYPFKMSVFDRKDNRQNWKKSIVFNYEDQNNIGKIVDTDYDFDFDNSRNFDDFIRNSFRNYQNDYSNVRDAIDRVVTTAFDDRSRVVSDYSRVVSDNVVDNYNVVQKTRDERRYDQRYDQRDDSRDIANDRYDRNTFPRDEQIQDILQRANTRRIRQIIQQVIDSTASCKAKSDFLEKLQGRVQNRISIFRTDAEKNRQSIVDIKIEIKALREDLDKFSKKTADYDSYMDKIKGYRSEIEKHTRDRDSYDGDSRRSRDNINRIRSEIDGHRSGTAEARRQAQIEERKIADLETRIADLEAQLRDAKRNRDQSRDRRDRHRASCSDVDRKIEQCNRRIKLQEDTISGCEKKSKTCAGYISDYNSKIEECNRYIDSSATTNKEKIAELKAKIAKNEDQIQKSTRQIDRLTALYSDIEKEQSTFQSLINKHYSVCYQYAPVDNNNYEWKVPSGAFLNYMKDIFGQVPNENIRARFSGTVSIRKNTIFSPSWTKVYGIPYTAGYGSNRDITDDNFSCTQSTDNLKVFSGKIEDITKNVITVLGKNGDRYTVHLGGCTRLQSLTDRDIPEKGSQVYFKGYERKDKHYNGYHITCY